MELAHRGLQEPGESARARGSPGRLEVTRRVGEHPPGCGRPPGGGTTAQPRSRRSRKRNEKRVRNRKNDYLASMYPKSVPDTLVARRATPAQWPAYQS